MLAALFGSEDSIARVRHDEELLAASARARSRLPELHRAFDAGLEPGEFIMIKAPFKTPSGDREWMWVEVTRWKNSRIEGVLSNDPFEIPTLHAGQVVEVSEDDVFDYIRHHGDGSQEGNETGKLIEKMSKEEKR